MQFLKFNFARDLGDDFPVVPGLLRAARHEFGGGKSSSSQSSSTVTRALPPPAPAPLAAARPTQSVTDLLFGRRRLPSGRSGTILTRDSRDTYGSGRRTILGTPVA